MGTINIRVDDELKTRSFAALEDMGITPSELLRQTLEYVAENHRLPFKPVLLTEEDAELLETVRERLKDPQVVKVSLDDL